MDGVQFDRLTGWSAHSADRRRLLQAAARRDLAIAAGDRGAAVLATWARWDRFEQQRVAALAAPPRPAPVRPRRGQWLGRAISRLRAAAAPAAAAFRRSHGEI